MSKEQKKDAIQVALQEYADNLAAVQESDIPGGFDQLVREALIKTLRDKFERIFDAPSNLAMALAMPLAKPAAKKAQTKAIKKKR